MSILHVQNLLIGSGEAAKYLAWTLSKLGQRTVMVERSLIGGSCPNIACLPSKNIIHSAKVASLIRRAGEFGVCVKEATLDMAGVIRRKQEMVEEMVQVHRDRYQSSGVEIVMVHARFTGAKTVEVTLNTGGIQTIQGDRVFINVGTRAAIPPVPGLTESEPMTHVEALEQRRLPEHLIILGGGYVGLEFAQAMRRFGSRVTIIQRGKQLIGRADSDMALALLQLMQSEGIEVLLESEVMKVSGLSGAQVHLQVRTSNVMMTMEGSDLMVAAGRTPNTEHLGLENAGVEVDSRGYVRVNDRLETSAPGVWAMGECAGSPQFTHAAFDDYRVVRDNLAGGTRSTHGRLIPYCLFTDPELAHVGRNETEARAENLKYRLATMPMSAVLRNNTLSELRGIAKALIGENDRILGFTAFGAGAIEMMSVVQTAMVSNVPYQCLRDTIFAHPTAAEGLGILFSNVPEVSKA